VFDAGVLRRHRTQSPMGRYTLPAPDARTDGDRIAVRSGGFPAVDAGC